MCFELAALDVFSSIFTTLFRQVYIVTVLNINMKDNFYHKRGE